MELPWEEVTLTLTLALALTLNLTFPWEEARLLPS